MSNSCWKFVSDVMLYVAIMLLDRPINGSLSAIRRGAEVQPGEQLKRAVKCNLDVV
jgi:hypothetical protein